MPVSITTAPKRTQKLNLCTINTTCQSLPKVYLHSGLLKNVESITGIICEILPQFFLVHIQCLTSASCSVKVYFSCWGRCGPSDPGSVPHHHLCPHSTVPHRTRVSPEVSRPAVPTDASGEIAGGKAH